MRRSFTVHNHAIVYLFALRTEYRYVSAVADHKWYGNGTSTHDDGVALGSMLLIQGRAEAARAVRTLAPHRCMPHMPATPMRPRRPRPINCAPSVANRQADGAAALMRWQVTRAADCVYLASASSMALKITCSFSGLSTWPWAM